MAEFTGRAKYLEIADDFKRRIRQGELAPGKKLPSETELMARPAKHSPEFEEIAGYLSDVRQEVRRLAERMDRLEQLVRNQAQDD